MLEEFYSRVIGILASIWRSFGSPRIAGAQKAVDAAKSLWSKKDQAKSAGTGLPARARNAIIAVGGVVVAIVLVWFVFSLVAGDDDSDEPELATLPTPTPFTGPVYLTEIKPSTTHCKQLVTTGSKVLSLNRSQGGSLLVNSLRQLGRKTGQSEDYSKPRLKQRFGR